MLPSRGHIQPHHTNLPRRHLRTRLPQSSLRTDCNLNRAVVPQFAERNPSRPGPVTPSTHSTNSTETSPSSSDDNPVLLRERSSTPVTSPLDPVLPADTPPENFPLLLPGSPSRCEESLEAAIGPTSSPDPHPPAKIPLDDVKSRFASQGTARGHLEPHATNLPRRSSRAQKEREKIQRRCLQEFIPDSGIWIAFDLRTNVESDDGNQKRGGLTLVEKKEHDWMWEEEFGFTGVVRVQIGEDHGGCRKLLGKRDELELVIGKEEIRAYDDFGIPVLTEDQLDDTAAFLVENRRRWNGKGKILITTPPQRPVEAVSIAVFASSLPLTSASLSSSVRHSPSYLTETRLLPGILELKRSQELEDHDLATDTDVGKPCQMRARSNYTPIHLLLWHIHDLASMDQDDESTWLKQEWRGAISQDGIDKLEGLVTLRRSG